MNTALERPSMGQRMALAAALALAGLAVLRAVVRIVPQLWFDVDPAFDPTPAGAWGPAESFTADACALALAGFIYWVCALRARALDALVAIAALLPGIAICVHGAQSADDAWRGSGWLAAFVSAAALWTGVRTLPRGGALRAALVAVLLALAAPLIAHGLAHVWVDHANTVAHYKQNREAILAAHGWTAGSPQALNFERRLMQVETAGWFDLSNVMSSVLAALGVALGGLAIVGWRSLERGSALILSAAAAACLVLVGVNGSKGALAAVAIGVGCCVLMRMSRPGSRWPNAAALFLIALAIAAVLFRGTLGEQWGERSVLFRWQYMQGALGAWLGAPLFGVGPAGFVDAYLSTRPALAPEEVVSAHSPWLDWLAALGVFGCAWMAVVVLWIARAGMGVSAGTADAASARSTPPSLGRRFVLVASACAVLAVAGGVHWEAAGLVGSGFMVRALGAVLAVILVIAVVQALEIPSRMAEAALFGAVVLLVVHAQIEMTLWCPTSVAWVLALIAVVTASPRTDAGAGSLPRLGTYCAALACVAGAVIAVWYGARPAAAEAQLTQGAWQPFLALHDASKDAAKQPTVDMRVAAARTLTSAAELPAPWANRPLRLAAGLRQWSDALARDAGTGAVPGTQAQNALAHEALVREALTAAQRAVNLSPTQAVLSEAQAVAWTAALTAQPPVAQEAARALETFSRAGIQNSPRDVISWVNLGRALMMLGQHDAARAAFKSALEADDSFRLDPLRQLSKEQRESIQMLTQP